MRCFQNKTYAFGKHVAKSNQRLHALPEAKVEKLSGFLLDVTVQRTKQNVVVKQLVGLDVYKVIPDECELVRMGS